MGLVAGDTAAVGARDNVLLHAPRPPLPAASDGRAIRGQLGGDEQRHAARVRAWSIQAVRPTMRQNLPNWTGCEAGVAETALRFCADACAGRAPSETLVRQARQVRGVGPQDLQGPPRVLSPTETGRVEPVEATAGEHELSAETQPAPVRQRAMVRGTACRSRVAGAVSTMPTNCTSSPSSTRRHAISYATRAASE